MQISNSQISNFKSPYFKSTFPETEITPFKFTNWDEIDLNYRAPLSSKFLIPRIDNGDQASNITYYFTKPNNNNYPIGILCDGSSDVDNLKSVIHLHRYFLEDFLNLGSAVITLEQWGIDDHQINKTDFVNHYTRSQRLIDHQRLIEHLKNNPPEGWNGRFILMGVSEGGPLITKLTEEYPELIIASINLSGADKLPWVDELWAFIQNLIIENPTCPHSCKLNCCNQCMAIMGSKESYDKHMTMILENPTPNKFFMNMSYKYHADAMTYKSFDPAKIKTPFLAVVGDQDPAIQSYDLFASEMVKFKAPFTYMRIEGMDHYVRKRPDIIEKTFNWLAEKIYLYV